MTEKVKSILMEALAVQSEGLTDKRATDTYILARASAVSALSQAIDTVNWLIQQEQ